jgi:ABC-type Fe3+ transport system substrate-binding protein
MTWDAPVSSHRGPFTPGRGSFFLHSSVRWSRAVIAVAFALVLGVPFLLRGASGELRPKRGVRTLVVITPHVPQIQEEFALAFASWHQREFGEPAWVDFRQPGGTSDILKLLKAQYAAAASRQLAEARRADPDVLLDPSLTLAALIEPGDLTYDVMFGGGSYDHGILANPDEATLTVPLKGFGVEAVRLRLRDAGRFRAESLASSAPIAMRVTLRGEELILNVPSGAVRPAGVLEAWRADPAAEIEAEVDLGGCARPLPLTMSMPAGFDQATLDDWYRQPEFDEEGQVVPGRFVSPNRIGAGPLYHKDQYWLGTALSGFGIVFNRRVLEDLKLDEPDSFRDMTEPRLAGWVALADPRMSGSIETTFESILNNEGWDEGWRILRAMCANARYVTDMSTKPPLDVAHGEAAMGLAIDFYGRSQAQAMMRPGETPATARVGYVDPAGKVFIDPDPISVLRGGRDDELAHRFIRFVMSDEGQALWQFRAESDPAGTTNPRVDPDDNASPRMGPRKHELRRMPVRRAFILQHWDHLIDQVDPYAFASAQEPRGWRSAIRPMMGAFGIDTADELRRAWRLYHEAVEAGFSGPEREEAERLLYALPDGAGVKRHYERLFGGSERLPPGALLDFTPENYRAVRESWRDASLAARLQIVYTALMRENYAEVSRLAQEFLRSARYSRS